MRFVLSALRWTLIGMVILGQFAVHPPAEAGHRESTSHQSGAYLVTPSTGQAPAERLVRPDGTIDLSTGFQGSLDLTGWRVTAGPSGEPRLVRGGQQPAISAAPAAPGDEFWDDRHVAPPGVIGSVYAIAVGSGKLYVGGRITAAGNVPVNSVAVWNGSVWSALGEGITGGVSGSEPIVFSIAVTGTLVYVGGLFTQAGGNPATNIARWNGTTWSPLGSGLIATGSPAIARAIAPYGTDVYVGGFFSQAGGNPASNIARWNGSAWSALGSGINSNGVWSISIPNDLINLRVYVSGGFSQAGGNPATNVAVWDGAAWSAVAGGTDGFVNSLLYVSDGLFSRIYAAGDFANAGGTPAENVAVYSLVGDSWSAVGSGIGDSLGDIALAVDSNKVLYAVGTFRKAGGLDALGAAKFEAGSWGPWGGGVVQAANNKLATDFQYPGVIASAGTSLFVGSTFNNISGIQALNVAGFTVATSIWSAVGDGFDDTVSALAVRGDLIYAGGLFNSAAGQPANRVAMWDGNRWLPLGSGIVGTVDALAVAPNGDLYAGGTFLQAGGVAVSHLARWNGSSWSDVAGGVGGLNAKVWALAFVGTDLYVGGQFTMVGAVSANHIARWDGAAWSALGTGLAGLGQPLARAIAAYNGGVAVGGSFLSAGGTPAANIAFWNGTSWSALGGGVGATVNALGAVGTLLYAGGNFTSAGGNPAAHIAKWNGSIWAPLGAGVDGAVNGLAVSGIFGGHQVYVTGAFGLAGGQPAVNIARWTSTFADAWSAVGTGIDAPGYAVALADPTPLSGPSALYVAGTFFSAGGFGMDRIARWANNTWSPVNSGLDYWVTALGVGPDGLYAGGYFARADGRPVSHLARWTGNRWLPLGSGIDGPVFSIAFSGTQVYVGGRFDNAGGAPATNVAVWNGSTWSGLGSGVAGSGNTVAAVEFVGPNLYAGGSFSAAGGGLATNIARWDGTNWTALGTGLQANNVSAGVAALATDGVNLFVGGTFETAGGIAANSVARWNDATGWSALGAGVTPGKSIYTMAYGNGDLFVGGNFTSAGDQAAAYVARWANNSWSALGTGVNGLITALAVGGADLYVGGSFTTAGLVATSGVARWDGSAWSALGSGVRASGSLFSLPVSKMVVSGSSLYLGGQMLTAGGKPSLNIARWTNVKPALSIGDLSVTEGNSGTSNATFTVSLSFSTAQTVTVSYATTGITATAGSDFTVVSGTLTIPAGAISATITVPILGDTAGETNETFAVTISNPVNAAIARPVGLGTIVNDDPPGTTLFLPVIAANRTQSG